MLRASSDIANINNPGFLKLDLLTKGIYLQPKVSVENIGIMSELELVLPGNILVNVAIKDDKNSTPYQLLQEADSFYVSHIQDKVEVSVIKTPAYYAKKSLSGVDLAKIGRLYGEYLIISPTVECEFLTQNLACCYCDVAARVDKKRSVEEVIETIEEASKENPIRMVCLNTGYLNTPDGGILVLEPYIKEIKKRFDVLIAIQAQPPLEDEWIDYTYALGVDSLAYNLEVYDPDIFERIAPGKKKLIGRDRYIDAIRRAAHIFPKGAVVSNLLVGLEPVESTIKGINALASMGVIPTLPIARKVEGMAEVYSLTLDDISRVYLHLNSALSKFRLSDSWISHANVAMNAIDGRYFGADAPYKGRLENILKSKRGAKLALNLAKLRRSLRVKKVG